MRILFAGSSGGHLTQLRNLRSWYGKQESIWLTFNTPDAVSALDGERVVYACHTPERSVRQLWRSLKLASRVLRDSRPDIVVSAGASLGLLTLILAKMRGIPTIYIEVFDRIFTGSLSGRIAYRIADRFCVQWTQQLRLYPHATVIGPLL